MKVRRAFMINNIKIGDKLQIHCYKHNGKLHQLCNEAIVLDIDEDKIVVGPDRWGLNRLCNYGKNILPTDWIKKSVI